MYRFYCKIGKTTCRRKGKRTIETNSSAIPSFNSKTATRFLCSKLPTGESNNEDTNSKTESTKTVNQRESQSLGGIEKSEEKGKLLNSFFRTPIGSEKMKRWKMIIPTVVVHLSIGSMYSWSMYNSALVTSLGVVAPSAADWAFTSVVPIFSTITFFHGISAWLLSNWQVKVGPRLSLLLGSLFFGGGMVLAGIGAKVHILPLMYIGYGVFGGIGMGLSYVPPMANLIRWFPEKVGFAAGITSCGFGGAALLAAPLIQRLLKYNTKPPVFIGPTDQVETLTQSDGSLLAELPSGMVSVVESTKPMPEIFSSEFGLVDGFYQVATGSSGADNTLIVMGSLYFASIFISSLMIKKAPPNFSRAASPLTAGSVGFRKRLTALIASLEALVRKSLPPKSSLGHQEGNVEIGKVMRSRQFYLLWIIFACLATVGMSIAGTAKDMVMEVFSSSMPKVVTPAFAVGFVSAFSLFNLAGRLFWASFSDRFGKQNTFRIFTAAGFPLCILLPVSIALMLSALDENFQTKYGKGTSDLLAGWSLSMFFVSSLIIASIFGGTYATVPAFATEMFGSGSIDKVHGRLLTASAFAGIVGPILVSQLRGRAEKHEINKLVALCDEKRFEEKFGVSAADAEKLIEAKTLTIPKLMEIAPEGTKDPTPNLYSQTLYLISVLFVIAGLANRSLKKVPKQLYTPPKKA